MTSFAACPCGSIQAPCRPRVLIGSPQGQGVLLARGVLSRTVGYRAQNAPRRPNFSAMPYKSMCFQLVEGKGFGPRLSPHLQRCGILETFRPAR